MVRQYLLGVLVAAMLLTPSPALAQRMRFPSQNMGSAVAIPAADPEDSPPPGPKEKRASDPGWQPIGRFTRDVVASRELDAPAIRAVAYDAPVYNVAQAPAPYPGYTGAQLNGTIQPAVPVNPQWDPYAACGPPPVVYPPTYPPPYAAVPGAAPLTQIPLGYDFPWHVYGEFLYLQPRNSEIPFAVPVNQFTSIQNGSTSILNPNYGGGVRFGFSRMLYDPVSLGADYTYFESDTNSDASVTAPTVLRSLVFGPSPDFTSVHAHDQIQYQLVDVDYRGQLFSGNRYLVNFLIGARYSKLMQTFSADFTAPLFKENLYTNLNFEGGGIRIGLEAERYARTTGLMVYGRSYASFMGGRFAGNYSINDGTNTLFATNWVANRVVPILDIELGVGWVNPTGNLRITAGYLFSAWYNVLRTNDFIQAVQNQSLSTPSNDITFDGLTARVEVRF